eukprot:3812979-Amphidinium_carterae.1
MRRPTWRCLFSVMFCATFPVLALLGDARILFMSISHTEKSSEAIPAVRTISHTEKSSEAIPTVTPGATRHAGASGKRADCTPRGMKVARLQSGFDMVVLETKDLVSQSLLKKGTWEYPSAKELASAMGRALPISGTFVDIGANLGYYS